MKNNRNGLFKNSLFYIVVFLSIMGIIAAVVGKGGNNQTSTISSSEFISQLKKDNVKSFDIQPSNGVYKITGKYRSAQEDDTATGLFPGTVSSSKVTGFQTSVLQNDSTVSQITKTASSDGVKVSTPESNV
ncbi:ATP-dependent metallopeptidase FtsH/Yme1/Tma family protein [Pediococcus acidilactici]